MESIKIIEAKSYLPKTKIENDKLEKNYNLPKGWIEQRSGIKTRYQINQQTITELAVEATRKIQVDSTKTIGIFVATTSTDRLMPGIAFEIQKALQLPKAICMDILCGCSGYINAWDIARKYLALNEIDYALVVGVEVLSQYLEKENIDTSILLGDGAGAVLLGKAKTPKQYACYLQSDGTRGELLTCHQREKIFMDGKNIYKYAVCETVKNIQELLQKEKTTLNEISYIIPHQSNKKILNSIANRLGVTEEKMYINIAKVGNTFCASIPIAIEEMITQGLLKEGNKILLLGYGGGLNLGSILMEV